MQDHAVLKVDFDHHADTYRNEVQDSLYGLKPDYFTAVKAEFLVDAVHAHFGSGADVSALDVGCGIGVYHQQLQGRFASLTGTDISSASLDRAAERHPDVDYKLYDGHRLPFDEHSFDVVFTVCVMHHVPPAQWRGFTSEMKRVLRPRGLAMVFEHNPANPLTLKIVDRCEFDRDAVLLRRRQTEQLLAEAGLGSVRSRCILSLPSFGPRTRKLDLMAGRLGLGAQYMAIGEAGC